MEQDGDLWRRCGDFPAQPSWLSMPGSCEMGRMSWRPLVIWPRCLCLRTHSSPVVTQSLALSITTGYGFIFTSPGRPHKVLVHRLDSSLLHPQMELQRAGQAELSLTLEHCQTSSFRGCSILILGRTWSNNLFFTLEGIPQFE